MAHTNQALFSELNKYCQNKEYDKALKSANKILTLGYDEKALRCKVVCHIFRQEYDKALQTIVKNPEAAAMTFEKAYCLYRQNKTKEAHDVLQSLPSPTLREKELLAQIMYRLERYEECQNLYLEVIKNTTDDYEEERKTNLAAVYAHVYLENPSKDMALPPMEDTTYELAYNKATILLAQEKHQEALQQLGDAEEICKNNMEEEEDVTEEEIEGELAILRIQQAYILQMLGKVEEALKLYNHVLKLRPMDPTLTAVAANNVITLNKDQNMFDSKKKMKLALAEGPDVKLTTRQKFGIAFNHCLVLLLTNNPEGCRNALAQAESRFLRLPHAPPLLCLLKAALKSRLEKQPAQAIQLLKEHLRDQKEVSLPVQLTLAQLLLGQGQVAQACELLRGGLGPRYPAVAAALVVLYQSQGRLDQAIAVLEEAIECHRSKPALLTTLTRCCAQLYLRNQQPQKAAQLWEQLHKLEPDNPQVLAQLISAYSQFDPEKARVVSQQLPDIDCSGVDVEQIESGAWAAGGSKFLRRAAKATDSPGATATANGPLKKKSNKKHKKGKLPKNYDPNVDPDPERWLPKHQRSTYKKRKDRRAGGGGGVGKGTQGSTNVADMESTKAPAAAKPLPSPGQPAPRHKAPVNKKKKKRGGGKW